MSKPRNFKTNKNLEFINPNTEVQNSSPERFAIKNGILYGVYVARYNSKVKFLGHPENWYKGSVVKRFQGVRRTYSYDELVELYPEYVF